MYRILTADEAVQLIKEGDCIGINAFLPLSNPQLLHLALAKRYREEGKPGNLRIFCAAGFGGWDEKRFAEPYIAAGAVKEVVASHYASMPVTVKLAMENKIEAYNLPLGVLSHSIRDAAAGMEGHLSTVGLNTFVDPRVDSPALNEISKKKLVSLVELDGKEYLYYKTPKIDVAFIQGTTADPNGNITFEKEYLSVDALALAQATKANGGTVIVQVDQVSHVFSRPRNVIIPGILVDAVVVNDAEERKAQGIVKGTDTGGMDPLAASTPRSPRESDEELQKYTLSMTGDIHVPPSHMDYYMRKLTTSKKQTKTRDESPEIIGSRAVKELQPGQVINLGIGIPEQVGKFASKIGILKDITMTVEAGGIGGLPAPGVSFGATIGADFVADVATQFDFYDGGGLDICFIGGLEVDRLGNVNAHKLPNSFTGIGGFANITSRTKIVVFCLTFTTKGLVVLREGDGVRIESEGSVKKFKESIGAISFSAKNALRQGQRVLYVTERCVFELTPTGLRLAEVYNGIDVTKDILSVLDFKLPTKVSLKGRSV